MKILPIAALCIVSLLGTSLRAQDIILLNQDGEEVGVAKDVEKKKAAAAPQVKTPPAEAPAKESTTIKDGIITVTGADGKVLQQFKLSEARSVSISRSTHTTAVGDGSTFFTENRSTAVVIGPDGVRREIELDGDGANGKLVSKTKAKSWTIGVSSEPASAILRSQLQLDDDIGLVVKKVVDNGAAKDAGLKANDIILYADQKPIATTKQLSEIVNEAGTQGNEVSLTVLRGGEEVSVSVTPVEREGGVQVPNLFDGLDPGIDFGGLEIPQLPEGIMLDFDAGQLHRDLEEQMDERMRRLQEQMKAIEDLRVIPRE